MAQKIQIRRDTAANWTTANPVLAQGEPGHEIDTGKVKFGNGIDNWNSLIYQDLTGSSWTQTGSGAVTRTVDEKLKDVVSVKDFGAVGDGVVDDTAAIQAAANASVGKTLLLGQSETYLISSVDFPAGVSLLANNSIFRKQTASSTYGIFVRGNFTADLLSLSSPGSASDVGIRVTGGNVRINRLVSTSDAVDSLYGIHFQSQDGSALEYVFVDSIRVENFKAATLIYYVGFSAFNNIVVRSYVTGVYLRDVYRTTFDSADIALTSPSATGAPGQNGLLVESTLLSSSSSNLRFQNWVVVNAPEHSYRFGGQLTIQDVWMSNCRSTLSGNAGAGAIGGCGFKVLGATSVAGQRHRDFFFENCVVEDVSTTGNGIGNFCGFLISVADNIHITNCSVLPRQNTFSCWHAYSFDSTTDVFLTNSYASECRQHALRTVAATFVSFPGWNGVIKNIKIVGGAFGLESSILGSAVFRLNFDGGSAGSVSDVTLLGCVFSGGNAAVRAESGITYTNNYFDFEYVNPGDTTGGPPLLGPNDAILYNFRGLFYGTFGPTGRNGSYYLDTTTGTMRMRRNGVWVVISDIDYGTWSPTITAVTNLDSASLNGVAQYFRFGNIVTVSGSLLLDATTTGSITVRISLPISSDFTSFAAAGGSMLASDGTFVGTVTADATNDQLQLTANANTTSARNVAFHATYRIS
jgi:hypothetical protein